MLVVMVIWAVFSVKAYALFGTGTQEDPYLIQSLADFDAFTQPLLEDFYPYWQIGAHTKLMCDIDLSGRTYTTAVIAPDMVHTSYSDFDGTVFSGIFDGNGHKISNLTIDATDMGNDYLGLFGKISGSEAAVKNLTLENITIVGGTYSSYVASLAGYNDQGSITSVCASGTIHGNYCVGGLVGYVWAGNISNSYASNRVTSSGYESVGGLVGFNRNGVISSCYASGVINGGLSRCAGGLVGLNWTGIIFNCYASGAVSSTGDYVGGLVGDNRWSDSRIDRCYSVGAVSGSGCCVGGLVGRNSYSDGHITNSLWDEQSSGMTISAGGIGKTTCQMQTQSTFTDAGWDFNPNDGNGVNWKMPTSGYPWLYWQKISGRGTATDPYLIKSLTDFDEFASSANAAIYWADGVHTKLMRDLNFSGRTYRAALIAPDTDNTNSSWVFDGTAFGGVFDGNGYIISNLTINTNGTNNDYLGLFGKISGSAAEIKNVSLEHATIIGGNFSTNVAALVGWNDSGNVSNSYSRGTVSGFSYVGGLVGKNLGGINESFANATISGNSYIGGLAGGNYQGNISDSYATGVVNGVSGVAGLVGYNYQGSINNSYAIGLIAGNNYAGGLVGRSYQGTTTASFWDMDTSGITTSTGGTGKTTLQMQTKSTFTDAGWDFSADDGDAPNWWMPENSYPKLYRQKIMSGKGTAMEPYLIRSLVNFNDFANADNAATYWASGVHIKLMCDINLTGRTYSTAVIAPDIEKSNTVFDGLAFSGIFDGNDHTIANLTIHTAGASNDYLGLFGAISGSDAAVKNLTLDNAIITATNGSNYVSSLAGYNDHGSIIAVYVSGTVVGDYPIGGLVGHNLDGSISNSCASCAVTGKSYYTGGLVGWNQSGDISNSCATGTVVGGNYFIGGLVGKNSSSRIVNCYASGTVSGSQSYIGGLVGENCEYSSIIASYATGTVSGDSSVGGLAGWNHTSSNIANCYAIGEVTGSTYIGGFAGRNDANISNSFWDTQTSGRTTSAGGTGKTTIQMQTESTFTDVGWDFSADDGDAPNWWMPDNGYPKLIWQSYRGDINRDGGVNLKDFALLSRCWLNTNGDAGYNNTCDLSGDNVIDIVDLLIIVNNWLTYSN